MIQNGILVCNGLLKKFADDTASQSGFACTYLCAVRKHDILLKLAIDVRDAAE